MCAKPKPSSIFSQAALGTELVESTMFQSQRIGEPAQDPLLPVHPDRWVIRVFGLVILFVLFNTFYFEQNCIDYYYF